MASPRTFIHLTKGSGGSLLDVSIDGYQVSPNLVCISTVDVNNKFITDVEPQRFDVGKNYSLANIADFFLTQRSFDTGKVFVGEADPVDLSTFLAPGSLNVKGNGVVIADGDAAPSLADHTDFGSQAAASGSVTRTFTVENVGEGTITLSGTPIVAVAGTDASSFTVSSQPQRTVPPGGSVTFQVTFDPSTTGAKTATLSIANSGPSGKNPYNFTIGGTAT